MIAVVAQGHPGPSGRYRLRHSDATIGRIVGWAEAMDGIAILDIQPGRADFFSEARRLEKWLRHPDVGIALDPEWRMAAGETPGRVIGSVESREVNATSAWVASIVERHDLPEKLFLIHQFTSGMIENKHRIKPRDGLAITFNVDGFGTQSLKIAKYRDFVAQAKHFHRGFKLFYSEDTDTMTPAEVMRLVPRPDVIVYE